MEWRGNGVFGKEAYTQHIHESKIVQTIWGERVCVVIFGHSHIRIMCYT